MIGRIVRATLTRRAPHARALSAGSPRWVTVKVEGEGTALRTETRSVAEGHVMVTDEPERLNGTNKGPTPLELLLGALVGCEQATARMVASRRGVEFDDAAYAVEADFDGRAFGPKGLPDGCVSHFQRVRMRVTVRTSSTQAELDAVHAEVAGICPVRSLFDHAGVEFDEVWTAAPKK